ncbi:MAG: 3D-(3,5/4)-trihydroxycyclohexane-1,2-dione acylhydrolase (decyclizing), partial [Deltaproteobacteria bacterium]|nr:3D-(3,5/4)-trihydroxycyclohexane-1,2-dione acylhydrolase (decyclizing) [Deltaproteobacteria bacterium]
GVHAAVGYARMKNRLAAFACTSSIGPGATNMVTGAALATINRLPVLLLPGDVFARRNVAPVLQQLESEHTQDVSVNDCFRPVSRYWDRLQRPDQLIWALPEVMRVLTSPAETGAVTLCLPQDVQTEAFDYPAGLFAPRVWSVPRPRADRDALQRAIAAIRCSRRPLIVAGGGVIYSEATAELAAFAAATGIPVGETQAGKGSLAWDHPQCLGGIGVTGTRAANLIAREADLVIGIGTRYSDFTTASKTAFADPEVRFVNLNVAEFDAVKHDAISLVADARVTLAELAEGVAGYRVEPGWAGRAAVLRQEWAAEVERLVNRGLGPLPSQAELIGTLNAFCRPTDVVVNAAGSAPGDLHKLWRSSDPKAYHVEYGYSCMGYEIPGALGVKLAAPEREVYALIGDGSWLMMHSDLVTALQEGVKLTVVLVDNHGFASIGSLSRSLGSGGFGCSLRRRVPLAGAAGDGYSLSIDYVANARSLGALALRATDLPSFRAALGQAREAEQTTVIVVQADPAAGVGGYESWWDVAVAEVAAMPEVNAARAAYARARGRERCFHGEPRRGGKLGDEG